MQWLKQSHFHLPEGTLTLRCLDDHCHSLSISLAHVNKQHYEEVVSLYDIVSLSVLLKKHGSLNRVSEISILFIKLAIEQGIAESKLKLRLVEDNGWTKVAIGDAIMKRETKMVQGASSIALNIKREEEILIILPKNLSKIRPVKNHALDPIRSQFYTCQQDLIRLAE